MREEIYEIEDIFVHGYTMLIDANDGEEQFVIVATTGQSGHVALRVLQTAVDGGHFADEGVRELGSVRYGELRTKDAPAWIDKLLRPIVGAKACRKIVKAYRLWP